MKSFDVCVIVNWHIFSLAGSLGSIIESSALRVSYSHLRLLHNSVSFNTYREADPTDVSTAGR